MLRWIHAWGWTVFWLLLAGRSHAFPISFGSALVVALLLVPGIYLPLRLSLKERSPDLSGELMGPLAVALTGGFISFMVLGAMSLLGFWDMRPQNATLVGVVVSVVILHGFASVSIFLSERGLRLTGSDDDA